MGSAGLAAKPLAASTCWLPSAAFPYVLLFLALLQVARDLHLGNNLLALSLPGTGLSLPLAILLLQAARFATSRRSWKKLLAWKGWALAATALGAATADGSCHRQRLDC